MSQQQRDSVYGYVRKHYDGLFITDITEIIFQSYLIEIESNILSSDEKLSLMNLLYNTLKQQAGNNDIKYIETALLYRASDNDFDGDKFHDLCDEQGATISIFHNEHSHIFGGYTSKSWPKGSWAVSADPNAFLFMIRPNLKFVALREEHKEDRDIISSISTQGPTFGNGWDIYIEHKVNGEIEGGGRSISFDFSQTEMCGGTFLGEHLLIHHRYKVTDYEVFSISPIT